MTRANSKQVKKAVVADYPQLERILPKLFFDKDVVRIELARDHVFGDDNNVLTQLGVRNGVQPPKHRDG